MTACKAYVLPKLHPILENAFQYSLQGEYLLLSFDSDYAPKLAEHDILICFLMKEHMCLLDTIFYPTENPGASMS